MLDKRPDRNVHFIGGVSRILHRKALSGIKHVKGHQGHVHGSVLDSDHGRHWFTWQRGKGSI